MKTPNFLDRRTLSKMASVDETHCVRVILNNTSNSLPYTVPCKYRRYVFERDGLAGVHVLDFPLSVWMHEVPQGQYRPNQSVSEDLKPTARLPLTIQVIPWKSANTHTETPPALRGALVMLREIFTSLNPPPVVFKALDHAEKNELDALSELSAASGKPATSEETPGQRQARIMREAKIQKQLEPA